MKIRTKIFGGFLIIIILTISLGAIIFINTVDVDTNFAFLVEHDLEVLQNAQKLQKFVVDAETGQRGFIITGDESFLEPYRQGIQGFNSLIRIEKDLVSDNPVQLQRLKNIQVLFDEWNIKAAQPEIAAARNYFETNTEEHNTEFSSVSQLLKNKLGKNILDNIRSEFAIFIQIENDLKDKRLENVSATAAFTLVLIIILPITIATVTGIITFVFTRSISRPLEILKQASVDVSNGKLNTKIVQTKSDDEIREVSESFNKMIKDIKKAQSQIQTQLKELTKIDEQKGEFAAMVSHELKTPIVPIQLYIEMFLQGSLGTLDDKQKKVLRTIHNSVLSLNELVDDVLDVTKFELGRLHLHKKQVDLKDLLDENIKSLSILANDKKVALKLDLKTSEKIFCDPKRINQILSNLIKNSIDYVPKNIGLIKLTIEKNPESFIFTVTDNGPGISVENHKHLFEKFYKMDTSITRKHGGTGLGLTICNGIVSSHGGKIWLDKEYTKGASFKFIIPVEES
jgi:signal transduction histidine kinase